MWELDSSLFFKYNCNVNYKEKYLSKKPFTLVCVGDSTTSQEWCHPNWIDWLYFTFRQQSDETDSWKRKIINSGLDGNDIKHTIEDFDNLIGMYKPDLVILSLGFNSLEKDYDVKKYTEELILKIKSICSDVAIWSTYETSNPIYSEKLKLSSLMYQELCKKFGCKFLDIYSEFRKYDLKKLFTYIHQWENEDWGLKPGDIDFIHCNEIGNQIIAEKMLKELFDTDLSFTKEWVGMGNMKPKDLGIYLIN